MSLRLLVLQHAAFVPFELFKSLLSRLTTEQISWVFLLALLTYSLIGRQFLTFEFLRKTFSLDLNEYFLFSAKFYLIFHSLKNNKPETTIRDFINLVRSDVMSYCTEDYLEPATAMDYLKLIEDCNLCQISDKGKADAIVYAAKKNRELTSTLIYVIDRNAPLKDDFHFLQLIQKLTEYCTRDILQYLIKHIFGNEISAELKAEIIAFLVVNFKKQSEKKANH